MLHHRIVELRKSKKITQEELAKRVGVSRSALSQYELGTRQPDYDTIKRMADFFEVSTDYLLGRKDDTNTHPAEKLLGYLDMGLTNEEIKKRMDFMSDIFTLTDKEVDEFMNFVRWRLAEKKQPSGGSASKFEEQ